jgi:radical SAM protein with 4Fe4S-binding SPASM domain
MSLLLMASTSHSFRTTHNRQQLQDEGTCRNCKHQGHCPYNNGDCSRSYYHKIYSDKKEKSIDKFVLK